MGQGQCNKFHLEKAKKECAISTKVQIEYYNKRKRDRLNLRQKYYEYDQNLTNIIQRQLKTLKKLKIKYEIMARKSVTAKPIKEESDKNISYKLIQRLEDRRMHFCEINNIIQEQMMFLEQLYLTSTEMIERALRRLQENTKESKDIKAANDIIDQRLASTKEVNNIIKDWVTRERKILTRRLQSCEDIQVYIFESECRRIEQMITTSHSSNELFLSVLECILIIEMWEAERFGIQDAIMAKAEPFSSDEASIYFQLIDDNQMKLNGARNVDLPQLYQELGNFYQHQKQQMDHYKCYYSFDHETTSNDSKISDNHHISIKDWLDQFNQGFETLIHESNNSGQETNPFKMNEQVKRHFKATQQYAYERRELLLQKRSIVDDITSFEKSNRLSKLKWWRFGPPKLSSSIIRRPTKTNLSPLLHGPKVEPIMKRLTFRGEDAELKMMKTVIRKTMNNQNSSYVTGLISLVFTVGKEETQLFSQKNDQNEAQGLSFYQSRLDIGKHKETALWVQISSKTSNFITDITIKDKKSLNLTDKSSSLEVVDHCKLGCVLCIERDSSQAKIVSSIQITYANTSDENIYQNDYSMLSTPLSDFGLAEAHLWVSHTNRSNKNVATNISRMKNQLQEYEEVLSKHPNDDLAQKLVRGMSLRIEATLRKEKEQRGLTSNHIEYITEFLALSTKDLNEFKRIFVKIDKDDDGLIVIEDIVEFLQESVSMIPIIKSSMTLCLGGAKLIDGKLSFGEFSRIIGCFAMFSSNEILKCLFCSIDEDGHGFISRDDFFELVAMLHPNNEIKTASRSLHDTAIPDIISYPFFNELAQKFPKVLFPMFRFQQSIRDMCLGKKWWDRKMRKYMNAKDIVLNDQSHKP